MQSDDLKQAVQVQREFQKSLHCLRVLHFLKVDDVLDKLAHFVSYLDRDGAFLQIGAIAPVVVSTSMEDGNIGSLMITVGGDRLTKQLFQSLLDALSVMLEVTFIDIPVLGHEAIYEGLFIRVYDRGEEWAKFKSKTANT